MPSFVTKMKDVRHTAVYTYENKHSVNMLQKKKKAVEQITSNQTRLPALIVIFFVDKTNHFVIENNEKMCGYF